MAVTYGFYDSLNHDRLYNAQQMSAIFDGIINDGVFMSVGNQFHTVAGTGMQVIVKSGRAWFDSTWTLNDAEYPLSIDAADVLLTRIDAVVLEVNSEVATRANTIKVVKGTPASTPAKPTLTNTAAVHQHALAYVTVAKNTTAITNSMIEIVVGKTETPYVTAILQTTDITDLFKKWENDFQVWFETVKGTLDGDVALNLQNQIDHCVKKADKATDADIETGTADKWVDASSIKKEIDSRYKIGDIRLVTCDNDIDKDQYLLCNGAEINPKKYKEYYEHITSQSSSSNIISLNLIQDLPEIYKCADFSFSTLSTNVVNKTGDLEVKDIYEDPIDGNIYVLCMYTIPENSTDYTCPVLYKLNNDKTAFLPVFGIKNFYLHDYFFANGFLILNPSNSDSSKYVYVYDIRSYDGSSIQRAGWSASAYEDGNYSFTEKSTDVYSNDRIMTFRVYSSTIYLYYACRYNNTIKTASTSINATYTSYVLGSFDSSGNYAIVYGPTDGNSYNGTAYSNTSLHTGLFGAKESFSGNVTFGSYSGNKIQYAGIPTRLTRFPNGLAICGRYYIQTVRGSVNLSNSSPYPCNYTHVIEHNSNYYLICIPDSVNTSNDNPPPCCIYRVSSLTNQGLSNRVLIWSSSEQLPPHRDAYIDRNNMFYNDHYIKIGSNYIFGYVSPKNNIANTYMYLKIK
nr:MAG TPA: Receptor Binding Protein [Caudoviricetes sp.]